MKKIAPVCRKIIHALNDGDELVCVYGGIGSGKSYAIASVCLALCQTRKSINLDTGEEEPYHILITRRTVGEIRQNLFKPFQDVIGKVGGQYHGDAEWRRWVLPNGSMITWRQYQCHGTSAESANTIEGLNFNLVISDETAQLPDPFFVHSIDRARLPSVDVTGRHFDGACVWISRPGADDRYLREAKRRIAEGTPGRIIYSRTRDLVPILGQAHLDKQRRNRSKAEFEAITQEVLGATYPAKGAIYSDFVAEAYPAGNLIDLDVDKAHPTVLTIDPGVNHTSCLWIQHHLIDGDPRAVVVDEWHPSTPTRAPDIVREAQRRGWELSEVIIDPAGGSRNAVVERTGVDILSRGVDVDPDGLGGGLGVPVRATIPAARRGVKDGIYKVLARICNADGERGLLLRRELWDDPQHDRGFRHAIQNYRWDPVSGDPVKGSKGKEADHCMDALRYYVCHHGWHGPPDLGQSTHSPRASTPIPPRRHAVQRRAHRAGSSG